MQVFTIATVVVVCLGISTYLVGALFRAMRNERNFRKRWADFGLSIAFCALFLVSWIAQGVAEWGVYKQEQLAHGETATISGYLVAFGQSTLENWQSEFLQLFSFVVLSALLIHRGSAESKDSDEELLMRVKRIEKHLGVESR